jgi:diacylglycerol kinase (ATP)
LGYPRYNLAALWQILRGRHHRARLTLDGRRVEDDFAMVVGCNTRFTGKGMKLAPCAELDDGLLDVVVVRRATRGQTLKIMQKVYDGSHDGLPQVGIHRVRSFAIEPASRDQLNLDGEIAGSTPVAVELLPGALQIFG